MAICLDRLVQEMQCGISSDSDVSKCADCSAWLASTAIDSASPELEWKNEELCTSTEEKSRARAAKPGNIVRRSALQEFEMRIRLDQSMGYFIS